jgi:hypothetical protein
MSTPSFTLPAIMSIGLAESARYESQRSPVCVAEDEYRELNTSWLSTGYRTTVSVSPWTTPADIAYLYPQYNGMVVVGRDGTSLPADTNLCSYLQSWGQFWLHHPDAPYPKLVRYLPKPILRKARVLGFDVYAPGATFAELCEFLESTGTTQAEFFAEFQHA